MLKKAILYMSWYYCLGSGKAIHFNSSALGYSPERGKNKQRSDPIYKRSSIVTYRWKYGISRIVGFSENNNWVICETISSAFTRLHVKRSCDRVDNISLLAFTGSIQRIQDVRKIPLFRKLWRLLCHRCRHKLCIPKLCLIVYPSPFSIVH